MKWVRAASLTLALVVPVAAGAQTAPPAAPPMHHPRDMQHMGKMMGHGQMGGMPGMMGHETPTQPGQAVFAAIQEIVGMLHSDPHTDWSKVDIDAIRQHLIDMDEVTMRAVARKEPIDGGLRIAVTGSGRTLEAIRRMAPDHAREIDGFNGWTVRSASIQDGVELTVTATSAAEAQKIRALGFMGIMVQGGHHQMHHLAMAKGEGVHTR
jgi:hypothetical protein